MDRPDAGRLAPVAETGDEPPVRGARRVDGGAAILAGLGLVFAAGFALTLAALARALRPTLGTAAELVLLFAPAGLAPAISGLARLTRSLAPPRARPRAELAAPWPPGSPPASELQLVTAAARGDRLPAGCFVARALDDGRLVALLTPSGAWRCAGASLDGLPWADVARVVDDGAGVRLIARQGPALAWPRDELALTPGLLAAACRIRIDRAADQEIGGAATAGPTDPA